MSDVGRRVVAVVIAIALGAAGYFLWQARSTDEPAATRAPPRTPSASEPEIRNPIPELAESEPAPPLPPLGESDTTVRLALEELVGAEAVTQYLVPDGIVQRVVATVDALPRQKLAVRARPVASTPGAFRAASEEEETTLDTANFDRYAPMVKLFASVDAQDAARLYVRLYPLFQQAYEDLGYPSGYFNDRLIETVDHLLAAPAVEGPVRLRRSRIFYEYADPALERLSAGEKLLVRMGPENAELVKSKLRELRAELARQPVPPKT